jgi:serine/threonine-protein kinase
VIDNATAKHPEDRYADDAELIADLEDVLAIETARAGSASGEVTSVLRTLPRRTKRRVPFRLRHRLWALLLGLVVVAAAGGVAGWVASRTHHGTGKIEQAPPSHALTQVPLCQNCAHDYNPDSPDSDKTQNPQTVGLAIDGQLNTGWSTQQYYDHTLGKPGVGLYVDASPGVAARAIVIDTDTPGWSLQIYASKAKPNAQSFTGWTLLSSIPSVRSRQNVTLNTANVRYRYYLVWITKLPPSQNSVRINELTLYK